jgi:hypothetical protein
LPCFRRRIGFRGLYRSKASPKALGSSGPRMAVTSAALRVTGRWHRKIRPPQLAGQGSAAKAVAKKRPQRVSRGRSLGLPFVPIGEDRHALINRQAEDRSGLNPEHPSNISLRERGNLRRSSAFNSYWTDHFRFWHFSDMARCLTCWPCSDVKGQSAAVVYTSVQYVPNTGRGGPGVRARCRPCDRASTWSS